MSTKRRVYSKEFKLQVVGEADAGIPVARRFKKRGMSWYKKGANPLLKLRLLKLNGEWDAYWQECRKEFARYVA
ncbi:MAG: hypothetical protein DDT19_03004 [Syntrophomonadaceae bacterium]|nr:hypothetical protein [Bacillota bacterium]